MATSTITERGFISLSSSRVTRCGATAPGDQHGADDDVGFAELCWRISESDIRIRAREPKYWSSSCRRSSERSRIVTSTLGAKRDPCRAGSDDAPTDHEDPGGSHAGDTADQQPGAAERGLQEVGAGVRRQPPGDLTHRRKQRECPVRGLDGLIGDRGRAGLA